MPFRPLMPYGYFVLCSFFCVSYFLLSQIVSAQVNNMTTHFLSHLLTLMLMRCNTKNMVLHSLATFSE